MEKIDWKVEGMTCSSCAHTVSKFLIKEGMEDVKVNPLDGAVSFTKRENSAISKLKNGINALGYKVVDSTETRNEQKPFLSNNKQRFLFTLPFTLILMLHMLHNWFPVHWLMNSRVQLSLCIPVFITGMWFFGRSALKSLMNGSPNMNVLISLGALASFIYSLAGMILNLGNNYLFFETTASIITLVFFGNYLEEASVESTQRAVRSLAKSQKLMANMIAFDDKHHEHVFPLENTKLKTGDLILIKNGEQVPIDCKIIWGDCMVNEAIITGESLPVFKQKKDHLIGGSILENGVIKAQVMATGKDTVLSSILQLVQDAQSEKPPMQKLADKISSIFVPSVITIALLAFFINLKVVDIPAGTSLMRAIALLVIACPCAMGIATPAAIAVGLGRAAKKGILFRNASSLESFQTIKLVVFDKTGTLTTGLFTISAYKSFIAEDGFAEIAHAIHRFSNHPLAKAVAKKWKQSNRLEWKNIREIKGTGIVAEDKHGNIYESGSYKILPPGYADHNHNIFILKNKKVIGWIDAKDEIRKEAYGVIKWLHHQNIKTVLLSGDRKEKCEQVAKELGIDEVMAEQTPQQKLEKIGSLNKTMPAAMVGDGINDAPALAKATLGISLSDASQIAMQNADVILMNHGLKNLPEALGLGRHTYLTIKQNLGWAFLYNIIAIPVAAIGLLTPTFAALVMGLSDVVLGLNSTRLFVKKVL